MQYYVIVLQFIRYCRGTVSVLLSWMGHVLYGFGISNGTFFINILTAAAVLLWHLIEIFQPPVEDRNQEQEKHSEEVITDNRDEWGPCGPDTHPVIQAGVFTLCQHSDC